jgi:tetratricopeptide (TPR) repeat protein
LFARALELQPDAAFACWGQSWVAYVLGRPDAALELAQRGVDVGERQPLVLSGLGLLLGATGRRAGAEAILEELLSRQANEYISPMYVGDVLTGLGRFDEACDWFERAWHDRSGFVLRLLTSIEYEAPIRAHERFRAIVAMVEAGPSD